uniref:Uncharacterized protein n=1 Tax=Clastoptera arizonana TaxID=38151 RepID=A0A1B6CGC7_9HEMI
MLSIIKIVFLIFLLVKQKSTAPIINKANICEEPTEPCVADSTDDEVSTQESCDYEESNKNESCVDKNLHPTLIIILLLLVIATIIMLCCWICTSFSENLLLCGCEGWVRLCSCCRRKDDESYKSTSSKTASNKYKQIDSEKLHICSHLSKEMSFKHIKNEK